MRRDRIDVSIREPAAAPPVLEIDVDCPSEQLEERLRSADGDVLVADELDVTLRRTDDESGVLALSDRVTGTFVLEAGVDVPLVLEALRQVRDVDDPAERRYRIRVTDVDGKTVAFEKRTLLVYDEEGSLSRRESLIPGGVEL